MFITIDLTSQLFKGEEENCISFHNSSSLDVLFSTAFQINDAYFIIFIKQSIVASTSKEAFMLQVSADIV